MESLDSLIAYCMENGRVCPQPQPWNELWNMLPGKQRNGTGWEPPLPLILAAWSDTPPLSKMLRLSEHLKWAADHGSLDSVGAFVRSLPENQWYHGD